jgi:hypothetical protein
MRSSVASQANGLAVVVAAIAIAWQEALVSGGRELLAVGDGPAVFSSCAMGRLLRSLTWSSRS